MQFSIRTMEKMERTDLAKRLKQYRIERDLTLGQIAALVKIGVGTVYRLENGLVKPNERTLYKLMKALPGFMSDAA